MNYLKIYLEGPLQYFYKKSNYIIAVSSSTYKTETHPTKGAVIGIIGAALGIERGSDELTKLFSSLDIKYHTVKKGSVFTDYQTVRPLTDKDRFFKVDGGSSNDPIVKHVEYLQDASFEVYVGGDNEMLDKIYEAFLNPVYVPFLGKKSCFNAKPFVKNKEIIKEEDLKDVYDCA